MKMYYVTGSQYHKLKKKSYKSMTNFYLPEIIYKYIFYLPN